MLSIITLLCLGFAMLFPTLMLTITYPFSKKCALFWSNYITDHTSRVFFAILKMYRGFNFIGNKEEIKNLPEQFMVISNHQSLIDIVVYLKFFYPYKAVRFVAKDTLGSVPMVGKMLKSQQHCMIPRKGSPSVAMNAISKFGNRVKNDKNQVPLIFPEGTRSRDGSLGQFYAAGFRRLSETVKMPVVVCALDGGWQLSKIDQILTNLKKGSYRVKILKVYEEPAGKEDEKRILEESRTLIEQQLEKWRSLPSDSKEL